ncbi:hypothetical protein YC2023_052916 [Brassica napus]
MRENSNMVLFPEYKKAKEQHKKCNMRRRSDLNQARNVIKEFEHPSIQDSDWRRLCRTCRRALVIHSDREIFYKSIPIYFLNPSLHVAVHSIIVEDKEHFKASPDLGWSDDEEDPIVDNLMSLLEQQFPFNKSSFTGGVTNLEVNRMREDAKNRGN